MHHLGQSARLAEECAAAVIAGSTRDTQSFTHLGAQLKHDNKVEQRCKGEKKLPAKGYSEASLQDGQQNPEDNDRTVIESGSPANNLHLGGKLAKGKARAAPGHTTS